MNTSQVVVGGSGITTQILALSAIYCKEIYHPKAVDPLCILSKLSILTRQCAPSDLPSELQGPSEDTQPEDSRTRNNRMYFIPLLVTTAVKESRFYISLTHLNKCIGFVMESGKALKTDKPYRVLFRLRADNPPIGSFDCTILNKVSSMRDSMYSHLPLKRRILFELMEELKLE